MMKGIIDKSRLEKIGKYINRQLIVHRNIENDTKWTIEESMIVELYDNYIELISKINNLQQENQQLKDNWDKLKQYLLGGIASDNCIITENAMLSKMQEIEKE